MNPLFLRAGSIILFAALVSCGCDDKNTAFTAVRGRVFYKDRPLTQGTIVFTPDSERGGRGDLATAEIQSDGSYSLKTKDHLGVLPGWHRVTIIALEAANNPDRADLFTEPRSLLPDKYRDPDLSGLCFEVLPEQINVKDFHLE
ncbi:MAG: hypothetical protein ACJ8FY_05190 [Gemmataceae bacterium]